MLNLLTDFVENKINKLWEKIWIGKNNKNFPTPWFLNYVIILAKPFYKQISSQW